MVDYNQDNNVMSSSIQSNIIQRAVEHSRVREMQTFGHAWIASVGKHELHVRKVVSSPVYHVIPTGSGLIS